MDVAANLKQVLRRLARAPLFTAVTLITLAAGVGANTVIFSVVEGVLLKPLPYANPEQLIEISHEAPGINLPDIDASPSNYFIYREQGQTLQDVGLYTDDSLSVTGAGEPEQVDGLDVTDGILPMLGVQPALGRWFTRADDSPGTPDTVVISYRFWQRRFGGAASAIGRTIVADAHSREVIGVLPRNFRFLDRDDVDLIIPFQFDRNKTNLGNFSYHAIARMKPGVTTAQVHADVARMLPIWLRSFPAPEGFSIKLFEDAHIAPKIYPLKQRVVGDVGKSLWVLMGSIGMVLLIACANVANLLLVRVEGRRQELAVRTALGAGWTRIAGELLFESVVLGLLGSVLGLGIAYGALRLLLVMAPAGLPRIHNISIDIPVLLFTVAIALFSSLLFGLIPIIKYAGVHASTGLREGGRTLSQSRERHRARSVLVVAQVAMALVLLICSGLMIRTFRALARVNPGFTQPDQVQSFRIFMPDQQVKDDEQVMRMEEQIQHKLEAIPGVASVAITTSVPMDPHNNYDPIFVQDHMYREGELPPLRRFRFIGPGFLSTVGIPLIAGRDLTWNDIYSKLPVAIVSENIAREYWNDPAKAIGKRIRVATTDDWREIVGVVGNVHDEGISQPVTAVVDWPLLMNRFEGQAVQSRRGVSYAIRTSRAGSETFVKEARQAVWSVNANLPLFEVYTVGHYYSQSMARTSFTLVMLAVAAGMALLLGVVGIYGVIAYSVSQRTREIGIRMALGAQRDTLTGMFVRHGLMLTGIGVTCGLCAAFAVMRLMSSLLFNVSPMDPLTYAAVALGLAATAFLASYLPSRRAASVDPVEALRAE
jgi:predicted permease